MTGVKMGDRFAQVGCAHGGRLGAVAAKVGLSGRAVAVVPDERSAARARKGRRAGRRARRNRDRAARRGCRSTTARSISPSSTTPPGSSDRSTPPIARPRSASSRASCVRGGRVMMIGDAPASGMRAVLNRRSTAPSFAASGDATRALQSDGFASVRTLAEREGLVFVEGIKPRMSGGPPAGPAPRPARPVRPAPPAPPALFHRAHVRWRPPSIGIVSPVIQLARSDARKRIIAATSSGSPGRPSGCVVFERSRNAAYCASSMPERRCRFVTVTPGLTALTRMPRGASLECRAPGQLIDRRLADAVREHAGERAQAVDARHVDDRALPCRQVLRRGAHQAERRAQVDRHHLVPALVAGRLDRACRDDAGRVDEHVDRCRIARADAATIRSGASAAVKIDRDAPHRGAGANRVLHMAQRASIAADQCTTNALSAAKPRAAALPMPLVAPVTITVRLSKRMATSLAAADTGSARVRRGPDCTLQATVSAGQHTGARAEGLILAQNDRQGFCLPADVLDGNGVTARGVHAARDSRSRRVSVEADVLAALAEAAPRSSATPTPFESADRSRAQPRIAVCCFLRRSPRARRGRQPAISAPLAASGGLRSGVPRRYSLAEQRPLHSASGRDHDEIFARADCSARVSQSARTGRRWRRRRGARPNGRSRSASGGQGDDPKPSAPPSSARN